MTDGPETTSDIAAAAAQGSFESAPRERDLRKHAQRIVEAALELDPVSSRVVLASLVVELLRLGFADALDQDAYQSEQTYRLRQDPVRMLPD